MRRPYTYRNTPKEDLEQEILHTEKELEKEKEKYRVMGDLKFPATKLEKFKNDLKEELEIRKKLKLAVTSYYKKAYSDNPDYNVVRESYFSVINFFPALKGFSMDHVKQAKYKYNFGKKGVYNLVSFLCRIRNHKQRKNRESRKELEESNHELHRVSRTKHRVSRRKLIMNYNYKKR